MTRDHTSLLIAREMRRLGVDDRADGVVAAVDASLKPEAFLRWCRSLPTGLGPAEFRRLLESSPEMGGPGIDGELPVADPHYRDSEIDELVSLLAEVDRIVPAESRPPGFGFDWPADRAATLRELRRVPSGSGIEALHAAFGRADAAR